MKAMRSIRRLSVLVCLLMLGATAFLTSVPTTAADSGASCIKHEAHERVTFLLVDRSDKLRDTQGLTQTLHAVREMVAQGERIMVGVSAGSVSETRIVMDIVRPTPSVWESVMKTRAKEKAYLQCFTEMQTALGTQNEEHKSSAVLETVSFAAMNLNADGSAKAKRLVVFSDMVQNSPTLSFFAVKAVDPVQSLAKVEKENLLSALSGVDVYVSGAGVGVVDDKARKIEEFWRKYFEKSGAQVKFYGPIFVGS